MEESLKKRIDELAGIENVREWMKAYSPEEWQIDGIAEDLTFDWLINHIHEPWEWDSKIDMDTAPREAILSEAIRRILVRIATAGFNLQAVKGILDEMTDRQ